MSLNFRCAGFGLLLLAFSANASEKIAILEISDGPVFDFGTRFVGMTHEKTIFVKNFGTAIATHVELLEEPNDPPFAFRGGKYPGVGGTCGKTLRAGQQCSIVLHFTPREVARYQDQIRISYFSWNGVETVARTLAGTGIQEGCVPTKVSDKETPKYTKENVGRNANVAMKFGPGEYRCVVKQDNFYRPARVVVPATYSQKPVPLVMVFHGGGEIGIGIETQSGFSEKAEKENFIVAYPEGLSRVRSNAAHTWNGTAWREDGLTGGTDDVAFVARLLDMIEKYFQIEPNRIYATGLSNGAMMTYRLACQMSDRFAAIAPVSGGMLVKDCHPVRAVPILHIHGTQDPHWPFDGGKSCFTGEDFSGILASLGFWQKTNRCGEELEQDVTFQKNQTNCQTRAPCAQQSEVTLCTIGQGGLTWPGGKILSLSRLLPWTHQCGLGSSGRGVGLLSSDLDATDMIWGFFQKHYLRFK